MSSMVEKHFTIDNFFPAELIVSQIENTEEKVIIYLASATKECICPNCGDISTKYRGTYKRKVQDLPVFGKQTWLQIKAKEYTCENPECKVKSFSENFPGFAEKNKRMTQRCSQFVTKVALETNCESASRILKEIGIQKTGCSIVHLLLETFDKLEPEKCSSTIGIDDFAFRKGHNYGTIIVDGENHRTIALLEGRDGESLRQWLQENKHVTTVSRDRSSAYSKVLREELPHAIQVADRFHLHHNFMEAIKKALHEGLPHQISIKIPTEITEFGENSESNIVENLSETETSKKRVI